MKLELNSFINSINLMYNFESLDHVKLNPPVLQTKYVEFFQPVFIIIAAKSRDPGDSSCLYIF